MCIFLKSNCFINTFFVICLYPLSSSNEKASVYVLFSNVAFLPSLIVVITHKIRFCQIEILSTKKIIISTIISFIGWSTITFFDIFVKKSVKSVHI